MSKPTIVCAGMCNTKSAEIKYLAEHIAGAELIMFPGAHHAFNVEFADRYNQAVIDFLS